MNDWLALARELDQQDLLANYRDRFIIHDSSEIYLDGNSLGRMPKVTSSDTLGRQMETAWGHRLINSWNDSWYDLPERLGAKIARVIGAKPHEVVVCDSTSVNLYKLAHAAMTFQAAKNRHEIVSDTHNFPSDLYVLGALGPIVDQSKLSDDTALVSLSHVDFKTGALSDLEAITSAAHQAGALTLWDLSHSVGALPINLNDCQVDLAVGCCYKYLNGGPGAPAFLFVREDLQDQLLSPIQGWFGHLNPFGFATEFKPAKGMRRFLAGTPPILSMAAIEPGVDLILEAGIKPLREKSVAQTEFLIERFDRCLAPLGLQLHTPRNPSERGSHVSLGHPHAWQITQALIKHHKVIPDFRHPDSIRFGVTPLYTTFEEIARAMETLRQILTTKEYQHFPEARMGIT